MNIQGIIFAAPGFRYCNINLLDLDLSMTVVTADYSTNKLKAKHNKVRTGNKSLGIDILALIDKVPL